MESQEQQKPELILSKSGTPFKTEMAAKTAMTKQGVSDETHCISEVSGGGFAIFAKPLNAKEAQRKAPEEKYFKVRFNAKSNPNDTDDVHLSVNGNALIIQRERDVVIPQSYIECADHARYPMFKQMPGQNRKITSWIKTYPYDKLGEATVEEYNAQKKAGTKKLKQDIEKYGFDVNPETMPDV